MQTTSTSKIIWIILGLFIIIGGAYGLTRMNPSEPAEENTEKGAPSVMGESGTSDNQKAAEATTKATTKASFFDLLGKTGAQKCSVTQSSTVSQSSGVFYSSGGKGRGDFESAVLSGVAAGVKTKSSMIMDGDIVYVWDPATKKGMKMSINDMKSTSGDSGSMASGVADQFKQSYDYNCESWRADVSLFVPPKDVEFVDMAQMMKGMMPSSVPGSAGAAAGAGLKSSGVDMSAMCAQCDQAGDGRDACRAALGCN